MTDDERQLEKYRIALANKQLDYLNPEQGKWLVEQVDRRDTEIHYLKREVADRQKFLDLRETQLANCTRTMRECATTLSAALDDWNAAGRKPARRPLALRLIELRVADARVHRPRGHLGVLANAATQVIETLMRVRAST